MEDPRNQLVESLVLLDIPMMRFAQTSHSYSDPDRSRIDSRFLHWQLHYRYLSGSTVALNKGSGNIRNLQTKAYLKQFVVVAPRRVQFKICQEIEDAFERFSLIERAVRASFGNLGALRRSVLAKAFAGLLVPQDPDDEPASALLKFISDLRLPRLSQGRPGYDT